MYYYNNINNTGTTTATSAQLLFLFAIFDAIFPKTFWDLADPPPSQSLLFKWWLT